MSDKSQDPTEFNSSHPDYKLTGTDLDGLGRALLVLTHELWVTRDRLMILEEVLAIRGIDAATEIENHALSAQKQSNLDESGKALIARVLGALASE